MIKQLIILLTLYLISLSTFSQRSIETDKLQIKLLITESFDKIWSDLNSNNIEKFYTKDFLLLENGEVWNNDSITRYLDKAILKKPIPHRKNTIQIIDIKIHNDMAWVAYHNFAIFSVDDKISRKAHWLESATIVLTENLWKIETLHSTRIKNEL